MDNSIRIPHEQIKNRLNSILLKVGFSAHRALELSTVFAENSLEGIPSHGLNKFAEFVELCRQGIVDKHASPTALKNLGAFAVYDGNSGAGICNAVICMDKAIELATEFGIGCVALRNTNHWMRGGTYGWQAANAGCISICFTNTMPLIVPWDGIESRLGNNPLVVAVPNTNGHVVLDMAMSQFAMGRIKNYDNAGKDLPKVGGYNMAGKPTKNPKEIVESGRLMPIGYWKGSGLALMLDLLCTTLSEGNSTADIANMKKETALSQIFICFKADTNNPVFTEAIRQILAFTKTAGADGKVRYPGEHTKQTRANNLEKGIPVDSNIWANLDTLEN